MFCSVEDTTSDWVVQEVARDVFYFKPPGDPRDIEALTWETLPSFVHPSSPRAVATVLRLPKDQTESDLPEWLRHRIEMLDECPKATEILCHKARE